MNKILPLLFLIILCFFFSCKKGAFPMVDDGYKLFNLEQAGWKSRSVYHNFSGIDYKATLVPLQYYILKNNENKEASTIDSIFSVYKDERIIEIEFQHENEDDLLKDTYTNLDYESAVKYMSFKIENDFIIVTESSDTITCSGVTFERNFKLAPFKRLLLHFGNVPEEENIQLVYNDKLFGNGLMKFKFNEIPIEL